MNKINYIKTMKHLRRFNEADGFDDDHDYDPNLEEEIREFEEEEDDEDLESNFDVEEHFTPLINWKLFRYLQDAFIDFADRSITFTIYIGFDVYNDGEYESDIYGDAYNKPNEDGENWERYCETYDEDIINDITQLKYGVTFHMKSQLSPQDMEKICKVNEDVVSKFNVTMATSNPKILCEFIDNI